MAEYRVNVYENDLGQGEIIGRVRYNQALDYYNGRNWSNGGLGSHKGITKLKDGSFVIIDCSDWQGCKTFAYTVSPQEALEEILKSGNSNLLGLTKFKKLKELYELLELENEYEDLEEER